MRPEFVIFKLIGPEGTTVDLPINAMSVIRILSISVPGLLKGPDGEPLSKAAAGLDVGFHIIPVDHSPGEAQAMLEGKGNTTLTKSILENA